MEAVRACKGHKFKTSKQLLQTVWSILPTTVFVFVFLPSIARNETFDSKQASRKAHLYTSLVETNVWARKSKLLYEWYTSWYVGEEPETSNKFSNYAHGAQYPDSLWHTFPCAEQSFHDLPCVFASHLLAIQYLIISYCPEIPTSSWSQRIDMSSNGYSMCRKGATQKNRWWKSEMK